MISKRFVTNVTTRLSESLYLQAFLASFVLGLVTKEIGATPN